MATFEIYRKSSIGACLIDALDEMVLSGTLSPEVAYKVLVQFDKVIWLLIMYKVPLENSPVIFIGALLIDVISFQSMKDALETQVKSMVSMKVNICC